MLHNVSYEKFDNPFARAFYNCVDDKISINEDLDGSWFYDEESRKRAMKEDQHLILPDWSSSRHPAQLFVHEFSHCAHWRHLVRRNGESNALTVWQGLAGTRIPSPIGRLITRFKLSNYAVGTKKIVICVNF